MLTNQSQTDKVNSDSLYRPRESFLVSHLFSKRAYPRQRQSSLHSKLAGFMIAFLALAIGGLPQAASLADELGSPKQSPARSASTSLDRVSNDIQYLSSDELKGRQPGTPEMKLAEAHIVAAYRAAGLKPIGEDDSYFQTFDAGTGRNALAVNDAETEMTLTGPDGTDIELKLDDQYRQLIHKDEIELSDLPLVFVGYGIDAAEEHNFDEYAEVDVEGKLVVLIRREPQQDDPNSVFAGEDVSVYAYLQSKVKSALSAGASAVMMVNDSKTIADAGEDKLPRPEQFGAVSKMIPFTHLKRSVLNAILEQTPVISFDGETLTTTKQIEDRIDGTLEPLSQSLPGWKASIKAKFQKKQVLTSNIVGVIEGAGPLADETIVIGAHYDHLGMGAYGSRSAQAGKEIHNGADDNATGTAAVMELARRFSQGERPKRRLVFICFTAEEMGLLGARHYVDHPIYALEDTVAMINFDMVGYLRNDALKVFGWNTSPSFEACIVKANEQLGLKLVRPPGGFGGSDHLPFDSKKIPNLFLHTGLNRVFHTPEDDFEAINCEGAVTVIDFSEILVRELANIQTRPTYERVYSPGSSAKLGVGIKKDKDTGLMRVSKVYPQTPAAKAGLKEGDVFVSWDGNQKINSRRQLTRIIKRDAGKSVKLKVNRDGREVLLTVQLNE